MADNDYCLGTRIQTPVKPGDKGISIICQQSGRNLSGGLGPSLTDYDGDSDIDDRRNAYDF
jgi:hypothetical protein